MRYAPVIVFVYNRVDKAKKTLESLDNNFLAKESDLYIFSDGPKNENDIDKVQNVRKYIKQFSCSSYFKKIEIIESQENKGLAKSIIGGVSEIISKYNKVIVIEDDLICSDNLLNFMNDSLDFYQENKDIWSISGYTYPLNSLKNYASSVYLTYRGSSWGWATWKDRWDTVNWNMDYFPKLLLNPIKMSNLKKAGSDLYQMLYYQYKGNIDSWAVRWVYNQTQQRKYTVYPTETFIYNIGLDGSGTHKVGDGNDIYDSLTGHEYILNDVMLEKRINKEFLDNYKEPFSLKVKGLITYPIRKVKSLRRKEK